MQHYSSPFQILREEKETHPPSGSPCFAPCPRRDRPTCVGVTVLQMCSLLSLSPHRGLPLSCSVFMVVNGMFSEVTSQGFSLWHLYPLGSRKVGFCLGVSLGRVGSAGFPTSPASVPPQVVQVIDHFSDCVNMFAHYFIYF